MKRIFFLNIYVTLGFILGFLALDFYYLWYIDDLYYSIQNFIPTSFISFLFYRVYLLIVVLIILNTLEFVNSKVYNLGKTLFVIESIIIALFFILYGISVENYFFIIPTLFILFFLRKGGMRNKNKVNFH